MKRSQLCVLAAAGIGSIAVISALSTGGPALAQGPLKPVMSLIINDTSEPVPVINVDTPNQVPVSIEDHASFQPGSYSTGEEAFTVDAGKRLVLEDATAQFNVPHGQTGVAIIHRINASGELSASRLLTVNFQMTDPVEIPAQDILEAGEPVRMYFEAGEKVSLQMLRSGTTGSGSAFMMLSGYLVDIAAQ